MYSGQNPVKLVLIKIKETIPRTGDAITGNEATFVSIAKESSPAIAPINTRAVPSVEPTFCCMLTYIEVRHI